MFLTDVAGWLRDVADPGSLVAEASASELRAALADVHGGMRPKLQACLDSVEAGVASAVIVDGRVPHSLLLELFTNDGQGTMILADGVES
jgi:acetylglutamate kinase